MNDRAHDFDEEVDRAFDGVHAKSKGRQRQHERQAEAGPAKSAKDRFKSYGELRLSGALLGLVSGLLGEGQLAMLYGDSGSGKSLIAVAIANHIALGLPFCGRAAKQGFVAYLAPEGPSSIGLRGRAWAAHHKKNPDKLPVRCRPYRLDLCHSDADTEEIIADIKELEQELGPCRLIVLDTVSRALDGGDENGPKDMGGLVLRCDHIREKIGCTVLVIHHTPANGDEPRGHRALRNACDVRILVTKLAEGLCQIEVTHNKDGLAGTKLLFRVRTTEVPDEETGQMVPGAFVVHDETKLEDGPGRPAGGSMTPRQVNVLREMNRQAAERRSWDFTYAQFADACNAAGVFDETKTQGAQRAAAKALREQLFSKKLIKLDPATKTLRLLSINR